MYTSKIGEIVRDRINVKVQVLIFKDGELSFIEDVNVRPNTSINDIKTQVKNRINEVIAIHTFADTLVKDSVLGDPINTPPTQAEIDKQAFINNYQKWIRVKKAIDVGILTGNEVQVVALLDKVKADFIPAYLDIL